MKTSKVILNMDSTLKKQFMSKARKEGLTMSSALNIAARAYVQDRLKITALDRDIEEGLDDIRNGRVISQEDLFRKLGL